MTKADIIRQLAAAGLSDRDIASALGCLQAYVRVCARQRQPRQPKVEYRMTPEARAKKREYMRVYKTSRMKVDAEYRERILRQAREYYYRTRDRRRAERAAQA